MSFRRFPPCFFLRCRLLVIALLFSLAFSRLWAQGSPPGRGDYLTVKIAVMGPGNELYFWWGHIALVIDDAFTGESRFFDYGIFSFGTDHFFSNFALGRLRYSCGVSPAERSYRVYRDTNRDITVYTLDLPPQVRDEVRRFAETNVLPENKYYWYHHFKDNCSTRIRDIVDLATGGQFKAAFGDAAGRYTLRQHVRRHTWFNPFFDWILNFLMGQDIDKPITVWEEMFLPQEVGNRIADFTYTGPGGAERKLVAKTETLNRAAGRPAVLDVPRRQWPRELALGLALSALIVFLALLKRRNPVASRVSLGLLQSFLGFFFGTAGTVLFFMTFFTNHDYTYHNINIIYINPLLLAAVPLGILCARGRGSGGRFSPEHLLRALWSYVFLGGVLTLLLRALPGFYQQNQVTLALVLPFALTLGILGCPPRGGSFRAHR
ncbi:MAG: DUF4105 domain-containing protein [Spirochaetaceae bacterium]|jgi:hypothetical protein|nr:DUF4105 domain-containing protein [Spirochaetaceae bacterium]